MQWPSDVLLKDLKEIFSILSNDLWPPHENILQKMKCPIIPSNEPWPPLGTFPASSRCPPAPVWSSRPRSCCSCSGTSGPVSLWSPAPPGTFSSCPSTYCCRSHAPWTASSLWKEIKLFTYWDLVIVLNSPFQFCINILKFLKEFITLYATFCFIVRDYVVSLTCWWW